MKKLAFLFVVTVLGLQACANTQRVVAADDTDSRRPLIGEKNAI